MSNDQTTDLENALARSYAEGHGETSANVYRAERNGRQVELRVASRPTLPLYRIECLPVAGAPSSAFCVAAATAVEALRVLEEEHPGGAVDRLERLERVILPAPAAPPAPRLPEVVYLLRRPSGPVIAVCAAREDLVCFVAEADREAFLRPDSARSMFAIAGEKDAWCEVERVRTGVDHSPAAIPCPMGVEGCELPHREPEAERTVPPGASIVDAATTSAFRAALSAAPPARKRHREEPEDLASIEGTVRYVRMKTPGDVRFLPFGAFAAHANLVGADERSQVLSAGRVFVDRDRRTVSMDMRDSHSLDVCSAPGDEDARAIAALLFPVGAPSA
jgi:hypothetical protein